MQSSNSNDCRAFCCHLLQAIASYSTKLCSTLAGSKSNYNLALSESIAILSLLTTLLDEKIFAWLKEFITLDKWANLLTSVIEATLNLSFEAEIATSDSNVIPKLRKSIFSTLNLVDPSYSTRFITLVCSLVIYLLKL